MAREVSPISVGLRCRCPACGEGPVFRSWLGLAPQCSACGADFSKADSGDGPAFFVMFLLGIIMMPPVLLVQALFSPPFWVHSFLWTPVIIVLAMLLLRPFKALMFALQWKNRAEEATWAGSEGDGK
ncbi:DUF983 domain-containing protein [Henriciella sp.]|uniref:DUF983 domain-containing protein n=1 Tax=Henriciella sp. TaxID=1968823 RepID=UPI00261707EE|nr:DUF983 domain-containing protein [Henriciella sp.]